MAADPVGPGGGAFLLELLHYAGWQLRIRQDIVLVDAARDGVEISVSGADLPEAIQAVFTRAMGSGLRRDNPEVSGRPAERATAGGEGP
jgi:hypothetical protein